MIYARYIEIWFELAAIEKWPEENILYLQQWSMSQVHKLELKINCSALIFNAITSIYDLTATTFVACLALYFSQDVYKFENGNIHQCLCSIYCNFLLRVMQMVHNTFVLNYDEV